MLLGDNMVKYVKEHFQFLEKKNTRIQISNGEHSKDNPLVSVEK